MPIQKGPANLGTGVIETAELATNLVVTHALGSASTPSITFTGDTNTGIFSPTADTIAFAEGGTESMRITSAGILAVGTTGPAGDFRMTLAGDDTINPGLVALNNQTGTQVSATLYASSSFGWTGTRSNHPFIILTNGTERLRIPSNAGGITFPATQVASSDANTLDDYEEGTWTPTMVFSGGAGTLSYGTRTGLYTKIGNVVYFNMRLIFSKGTAAGVLESVSGLPFTVGNTANGGGVYIDGMSGLTGAAQYGAAATTLYVYMSQTGNANSINVSSMAASNNVFSISGFYIV